jgi:hypothetical protein
VKGPATSSPGDVPRPGPIGAEVPARRVARLSRPGLPSRVPGIRPRAAERRCHHSGSHRSDNSTCRLYPTRAAARPRRILWACRADGAATRQGRRCGCRGVVGSVVSLGQCRILWACRADGAATLQDRRCRRHSAVGGTPRWVPRRGGCRAAVGAAPRYRGYARSCGLAVWAAQQVRKIGDAVRCDAVRCGAAAGRGGAGRGGALTGWAWGVEAAFRGERAARGWVVAREARHVPVLHLVAGWRRSGVGGW